MPTKIVVPELGESVVEATVGHWRKQQGDRVAVGDILVELETEKVDLEVGAERAGVLARVERKEGEDVKIGDLLGVIEEAPADGAAAAKSREAQPARKKEEPKEAEVKPKAGAAVAAREEAETAEAEPKRMVTPLARRIAEEHGVDLSRVQPSDAAGRIRQRDVESFMENHSAEAAARNKAGGQTCRRPARAPACSRNAIRTAKAGRARPNVPPQADDCPPPGGSPTHRRHAHHF